MCSTFSRLHQEEPLNVAEEVIQTEVQINVGARKKVNKLGVHITEMYEEKKKVINENMQVPNIAQTDILAWSREKIAEIKANASHDIETLGEKNDYEYRIPITKSTEELLSNKKKKNQKNSRINDQAKLTNQSKKNKKETNPSKPENSKAVDNNKSTKRNNNNNNKLTKGVLQKKNGELNKSVPNPNKTNKNFKGKEKISGSIQNVSTKVCALNTCGICITKLNMHKRENSKCITKEEEFENHIIQLNNEEGSDEIKVNESELNKHELVVNEEIQTCINKTKKNNNEKIMKVKDVT